MRVQMLRLSLAVLCTAPGFASTATAAVLTRGPYLQSGTPTSVVVRWRTDVATDSQVRYGWRVESLDQVVTDGTAMREHEVALTALRPDTTYFYSIGSTTQILGQGGDFFFVTTPSDGKPTRLWVLGDAGTQNFNQRAVRDAYYNFTGTRHTDLWLMLGDNAYSTGTDSQYQAAVFNMYPTMLRKSVLWPTIGNHDTAFSYDPPPDLPYFQIFTLPTGGQAGGVPSGTEKYYSYDYGNIHLICLDSMGSDRSSNGPMCRWLEADLMNNTREWVFAYWHHPPYTKGSHDSDREFELIEMRHSVLPILEAFGVDLVMCGHSHCYERSFLLFGHYGFSSTLDRETMIQDSGSGREAESGAYVKGGAAGPGGVYVVAGSSGQTSGGSLNHPAMFISLNELGSLVLDVDGRRLDATFLRADGTIGDSFTILKGASASHIRITSFTVESGIMSLTWTSRPGRTYYIERATTLQPPDWEGIGGITAEGETSGWSTVIELNRYLFYRVANFDE
jgi:hypothetical protein